MSIWENKPQTKLFLICDIGSTRAAAAVVLFSVDRKPKIIHQIEIKVPIQETPDKSQLQESILRALGETLKRLSLELGLKEDFKNLLDRKITQAYVFFSASWHISSLREVKLNNPKNILLDRKLIDQILEKQEKDFKETVFTGRLKFTFEKEFKVIERNFLRIMLNGYETADPYMKRAKDVNFLVFLSAVPFAILNKIDDLIHNNFHVEKIDNRTLIYSSLWTLRNLFPSEEDLLLINVSGETTEIAIESQECSVIESFGVAQNEFIRMLMSGLKVTADIAYSYSEMFINNKLEASTKSAVLAIAEDYKKKWLEEFNRVLLKYNLNLEGLKTFLVGFETMGIIKEALGTTMKFPNKILNDNIETAKFVMSDSLILVETYFVSQMELIK